MREMKDSGVAWIDNIPKDWAIIPLKMVAEYRKGLSITKADLSETGIPVVSYGQIHSKLNSGTHLSDNLIRFVSPSYLSSNPSSIGKYGDLLFADTSEDYEGIGNAVYLDTSECVFAGYHTIIVRPTIDMERKYLAYLCRSDCWRSQLRARAFGIKVYSVTQTMLKSVSILLPPTSEQQKIVSILDLKCCQINDLIANGEAQIEKLKQYKQSVIAEVVTKGLDPTVPMKDSGVAWIGDIPAHWEVKRGKALFQETEARSIDGSEELLTVSQYTGITPRSQKNVNMFEALTLEGYKICEIGDIAANTMWLWAGAIGVSKYRGVISPSYNVYRQKSSEYVPEYLDILLRAPMLVQEYASLSTGIRASRLRCYPKDFLNIRFPVPPLKEQEKILCFFAKKFAAVDRLISIKQDKIEKLEQYKRSLIYEYVTGKKEVTV